MLERVLTWALSVTLSMTCIPDHGPVPILFSWMEICIVHFGSSAFRLSRCGELTADCGVAFMVDG